MNENDDANLDTEYKRYLQIMRPYLGQLIDQDVIHICNAWINRLSNCSINEKCLRNKYVFALCYQLAKGVLEDPFLEYPPVNELQAFSETYSEVSSSELECLVIDSDETNTKVFYRDQKSPISDAECPPQNCGDDTKKNTKLENYTVKRNQRLINTYKPYNEFFVCYTNPEIPTNSSDINLANENYEHRANNLIMKLRQIKNQNLLLHTELSTLKKESNFKAENTDSDGNNIVKIDNATSGCICSNDTNYTLQSLKNKLQEIQESRNGLIETIGDLQEKLDNFNELKNQEFEDIQAKHRLEIINIKSSVREETKALYEKKIEEIKEKYETHIKEIEQHLGTETQFSKLTIDEVIVEKDNSIKLKNLEIDRLKTQLEEQKKHTQSILNKLFEKSNEDNSGPERLKSQQLEKRLSKVEKSKAKCIKTFESKLTYLQREKQLAECGLQLQLVKQRTQMVNEMADEHQAEISAALDKLETKYKDIVANVQATAIQRRIQDQLALESILQRACGIQGNNCAQIKHSNFTTKTMRNENKDLNDSYDTQFSTLLREHKIGNQTDNNKSLGDASVITGYCLDSDRLGELFERVYIPQRDTGDGTKK